MFYHFGLLLIFVWICLLRCAAQSPGGSHHRLLLRRLPAGHGRGPAEAAGRHLSAGVRQAGAETRVSQWTGGALFKDSEGGKERVRRAERGEILGKETTGS